MKKIILIVLLLAAARSSYAVESIYGDLFPYENKHSSFTVDIDAGKLDRFSIEVVYSTEAVASDLPFDVNKINLVDNTISGAHRFALAQPVLLSTPSAGAPQPLVTGTTYFAVKVSDTLIKLATTYAQAISGDAIDITTLTPSTGTWTLRPLNLNLGAAGFLWQASNDATNYINVGSVGSSVTGSTQSLVTMGAASQAQRLFDWGEFPYKYLRFIFNGPSAGVIKLRAYINAKTRE